MLQPPKDSKCQPTGENDGERTMYYKSVWREFITSPVEDTRVNPLGWRGR